MVTNSRPATSMSGHAMRQLQFQKWAAAAAAVRQFIDK